MIVTFSFTVMGRSAASGTGRGNCMTLADADMTISAATLQEAEPITGLLYMFYIVFYHLL